MININSDHPLITPPEVGATAHPAQRIEVHKSAVAPKISGQKAVDSALDLQEKLVGGQKVLSGQNGGALSGLLRQAAPEAGPVVGGTVGLGIVDELSALEQFSFGDKLVLQKVPCRDENGLRLTTMTNENCLQNVLATLLGCFGSNKLNDSEIPLDLAGSLKEINAGRLRDILHEALDSLSGRQLEHLAGKCNIEQSLTTLEKAFMYYHYQLKIDSSLSADPQKARQLLVRCLKGTEIYKEVLLDKGHQLKDPEGLDFFYNPYQAKEPKDLGLSHKEFKPSNHIKLANGVSELIE